MYTRSRIIAGASGFAGEPPDEPLPGGVPHWLRFELAADIETELTRDLNLSSQNRTMAKVPIRLNTGQQEFSLNQPGLEDAVYATLTRDGASGMVPIPIEISNVSNLEADAAMGKSVLAFYSDRPQIGRVSWFPDGTETLTIWYDRSPVTDPSVDQTTFSISDSYVPLLKLMLAAQMLELMNKPIGEMLKSRIQRGLKQWEQFAINGRQQGVIKKTTYRPGHRGGSIWDAWPGRVPIE